MPTANGCLRAFVFSLSLVTAAGCRQAGQAVDAGGRGARKLIGSVEPTGVVAETEMRTRTWETIQKRADELDIKGFNAAVARLTETIDLLKEQLGMISKEDLSSIPSDIAASARTLREQLDKARVGQTSEAIRSLADALRQKADAVPTEEASLLIEEVTLLAQELRGTVKELDQRLETALQEAESLTQGSSDLVNALSAEKVRDTVEQLQQATARVNAAVEPIGQAGARWPKVTAQVDATLRILQLAAKVAIVVIGLFGLCAVVWLLRAIRRRPAVAGP